MEVTPEGFLLSYEVLDGNRADVATLEAMLDQVDAKRGRLGSHDRRSLPIG